MQNLGNLLKGNDNSLDNNFSLFQLENKKEVTKKVAHGKEIRKVTEMQKNLVKLSFSAQRAQF